MSLHYEADVSDRKYRSRLNEASDAATICSKGPRPDNQARTEMARQDLNHLALVTEDEVSGSADNLQSRWGLNLETSTNHADDKWNAKGLIVL